MRIIGLDIHRACAEAVAWQDGKHKRIGRIEMRRSELTAIAALLSGTDVVEIAQSPV
jgi:transposase